jgi:hypothetical protein
MLLVLVVVVLAAVDLHQLWSKPIMEMCLPALLLLVHQLALQLVRLGLPVLLHPPISLLQLLLSERRVDYGGKRTYPFRPDSTILPSEPSSASRLDL